MAMLDVKNISKSFGATRVLEDISFSLEQGETVAVIGASGSGKTTLLRCLTYLEKADKGTVAINGQTVFDAASQHKLTDSELRDRRLHFGMVFQSFNLFPQYTALENVMLAGQLLAKERPDYKGGGQGQGAAGSGGSQRPDGELPPPALRRTAAAGGHRPCPGAGTGHPLLR